MNDVFISYATEDVETAKYIADSLQEAGISVWFDKQNLRGGEIWAEEINTVINSCSYFIIILSKSSISKIGYVRVEIEVALKRQLLQNNFIIPVRLDDCEINFYELERLHIIRYFDNTEKAINNIIRVVSSGYILNSNIEIIGFDLGHGETSATLTNLQTLSEPRVLEIINNKTSIITAFSFTSDKGIVIGEDAILSDNVNHTRLLFKSSNFNDKKTSDSIYLFVNECIKILTSSSKINNHENTYFIVGCPSSWGANDRNQYKKLLTSSGMKNVNIIPESRAAYLDARESGDVTEEHEKILIIDIGSSTTDFTHVKNKESFFIDSGDTKLGSSLIDELIYIYTINSYPDTKKNIILKHIVENDHNKAKALLLCRMAKEQYFNKPDDSFWQNNPVRCSIDINEDLDISFRIKLYKEDMMNILSSKISILNNLSWRESFKNQISAISNSLYPDAPTLILLTGGGSRMNFIIDVTKEVFPTSEIRVGQEPSLSVAKGLALAGKIDIKVNAFKIEVERYIYSSRIDSLIEKNIYYFYSKLSDDLTKKIIDISSNESIRWRNGFIPNLDQLDKEIKGRIETYLTSSDFIKLYNESFFLWTEKYLNNIIEQETSLLCQKYGIKGGKIIIEKPTFGDFKDHKLPHIQGKIDGYYDDLTNFIAPVFLVIIVPLLSIVFFFSLPVLFIIQRMFPDAFSGSSDSKTTNEEYDIPIFIRKNIIFTSDESVVRTINENRTKINDSISSGFKEKFLLKEHLLTFIKIPLREMLLESADKKSLLIK